MPISNLNSLSPTYHNLQAQRIEMNRRRIYAKSQMIVAGRTIPDPLDLPIGHGRRLEAAVLFLDICNFTRRPSETAGEQEAQVRILSLFFSEMIRIVSDYGGKVEKNTGDGIMAYFAKSSGSGDPRQRAVASAMTMFHAASSFINPNIHASGLEELDFRICIDFGWMTVARFGAAQRFNHIVAVGSVANRTSKMLQHAGANEILVGDAMLEGLPTVWLQKHVTAKSVETGWQYPNGAPYTFWLFDGRWFLPNR
jgi:class 3 adenylate cyclase